ncbi:transposase [Bradyrhizobium sp. GM22.5]
MQPVEKGGPDHAIGRSRGRLSTKINAVVDENGLPLRIVLSAGQASDKTAVAALLEGLPPARALIAHRGSQAIVASMAARRTSRPSGTVAFSARSTLAFIANMIERFFCKIKHFRRVATRFDKLARNFLTAVLPASTRPWLRAYESTT